MESIVFAVLVRSCNIFFYALTLVLSFCLYIVELDSGHILMKDVVEIKTIHDKTREGNKQYRLEIHTDSRVWMLCPNSVEGLQYWSTILSASTPAKIPTGTLVVVDQSSEGSGEQKNSSSAEAVAADLPNGILVKEGPVRRKDYFTEGLRPRHLHLHLNRLLFRPTGKPNAVSWQGRLGK